MTQPAALDHAGIAARIPHAGSMCLLDTLVAWDDQTIHCTALSQARPDNPLRSARGLLAPCAIEYAAQAMALHGALNVGPGEPVRPGFLASARQVRLHVARLDDTPAPMHVRATRLAGDAGQALYRFELHDANGRALVDGRAAVVLNSPLPLPS